MTDTSPVKWHLAHTTWFFETFVLEALNDDYRPFHPDFRTLFNSYYHSVGSQHPRPRRGLLTRPSLEHVFQYREHVEQAVTAALERGDVGEPLQPVLDLGLHHEQQHQELILTDVKNLFAQTCLESAYANAPETAVRPTAPLAWKSFAGDIHRIGNDGSGFAFDNELPRHRVVIEPFSLADRLITNGEYCEFIEAGGYRDPILWLSDGWAILAERGWDSPLYWSGETDSRRVFTLNGSRHLRRDEPVTHLSYFEADAFARWAGARLPTEAEWELAAGGELKEGNFVESKLFHPRPRPERATGAEAMQLFGDVWEWTRSPFAPYPGYRPPAGALGEYNGKFMANQMTLRGGSCATPRSHIRATYRNFFPPDARWQFSGLRLAKDG